MTVCARIELAFSDEHGAERAHERLRHRERDVLAVRGKDREVLLVDDLAPVQHDDRVGVVRTERLAPCHGLVASDRRERQAVEAGRLATRQCAHRAFAARDVARREDLAPVREGPAGLRELVEAPVRETNRLVWRWWRADHPAERHRVGLGGIRQVCGHGAGEWDRDQCHCQALCEMCLAHGILSNANGSISSEFSCLTRPSCPTTNSMARPSPGRGTSFRTAQSTLSPDRRSRDHRDGRLHCESTA